MNRHKMTLTLFLLIFITHTGLFSESLDLRLYIQKMEHAAVPEVFGDSLIFTFESPRHVYYVGARFSHENFSVLHSFQKNEYGIFFLILPMPKDNMTIKYRFMVDGLWMSDPKNPIDEVDMLGNILSVISVSGIPQIPFSTPTFKSGNIVEFTLKTSAGKRVFIAGNFNSWDPFSHQLSEISPGIYRIQLKLYPGRHNYYFLVDGIRMIDPRNERIMVDNDGLYISTVMIARDYQ